MIKLLWQALAVALSCVAGSALAQSGSGRPITFIVPISSGTGADIVSRVLAPRLSPRLGQPIIVENRVGASGSIGIGAAAKAAPDGNTILIAPSTMSMLPMLSKSVTWDPVNDFVPIARLVGSVMAVVASPNLPANSMSELITLTRSQPGKLNYATPGVGTPHHLLAEMFRQETKIAVTHVPYKTSAGAITDLVGGQVQFGFFPLHGALALARGGKLKLLSTLSDTRSPWTPDVPTIREAGVENVFYNSWTAAFAPRGTPPEITNRFAQEMLAILALPEVRAELLKSGMVATPGSGTEMGQMLKHEITTWSRVVKNAGLGAE